MSILKFFATGQITTENTKPSRFLPCVACPGEGSRIYDRNYQDQFSYDFKQASHRNHPAQDYKQSLNEQNTSYDKQNKFYLSKYNNIGEQKKMEQKSTSNMDQSGQSLQKNNHYSNWKIQKEKKFASQIMNPTENVTQAQVLPKEVFQSIITQQEIASNQRSSSQPNFVGRENMYVTKPLKRLDKDFKEQLPIRNAQTVSEDTPNWCQTSNHFHTSGQKDNRKPGQKQSAHTDIFGNQVNKFENNFLFQCIKPSYQRFEGNRMVIAEKDAVKQAKTMMSVEEMKKGKCRLEWKEDSSKQKFDFPVPLSKIGHTSSPFFKNLEQKRNPEKRDFSKIGEPEVFSRIEKDKSTILKIGHGSAASFNPLKY